MNMNERRNYKLLLKVDAEEIFSLMIQSNDISSRLNLFMFISNYILSENIEQ